MCWSRRTNLELFEFDKQNYPQIPVTECVIYFFIASPSHQATHEKKTRIFLQKYMVLEFSVFEVVFSS
jgi:hypothetical protein